ncbi:GvpL/GvpF family gas vesicle protein [Micromonospora sp. DR5-3]|uniref:GvpL/GvpF family gas vesicle protein n=1 Tax=unclassified Micromonospora TaxID=2617518 RepID=UPI001651E808|nr:MULTISPECIES: GvpL/GvpF family gas vesicle protein [unclassified Micromonospora]MCW3819410.1 GvpL/GvpF family gas vesicle protein [Micromonospora sp. DR5-3]
MLVVYALVRSTHPLPERLTGIGKPAGQVRLVGAERVAAVVSQIGDQALHDDDAIGYLDVLQALIENGPVLPIRFGTLAPDDDAVRTEILAPLGEQGASRLDQLDGLVEMQLKLIADQDAELRDLLASSPPLRRLVGQVKAGAADVSVHISVGEQVTQGLAERRAALDAQVAGRLKPLALDHGSRTGDDVTVLTQYYLVRVDDLERFDAAVQELLEDLGDRYTPEYVGPLPPLDFADAENDLTQTPSSETTPSRWGW